jgi:hypothetical protein
LCRKRRAKDVLKGHGFSRAEEQPKNGSAFTAISILMLREWETPSDRFPEKRPPLTMREISTSESKPL